MGIIKIQYIWGVITKFAI